MRTTKSGEANYTGDLVEDKNKSKRQFLINLRQREQRNTIGSLSWGRDDNGEWCIR